MTSVDQILDRLDGIKRLGNGWSARCPAHDDRNPSLSIRQGEDGRILLHCHAGCSFDAICAALGVQPTDLSGGGRSGGDPAVPAANGRVTYPSAQAAVQAALSSVRRQRGAEWAVKRIYPYHDRAGTEVAQVARFEPPEGNKKEFRPISTDGRGGWRVGDPTAPWPLYGMRNLDGAARVFVVEGEKAVEAAASIGLAATTSAHGAKSARKSDWSPLAGLDVVILPDNDDAGQAYAAEVADLLLALDPRPTVRIVELPGLPEGGDIVEFVESQRQAGEPPVSIKAAIEQLASDCEACSCSGVSPTQVSRPAKFPLDALPLPVAEYCRAVAEARQVDVSVPAALSLVAMACAIGMTRVYYDEYADWNEVPVIWVLIVSRSGTRKTPVLEDIFGVHKRRQEAVIEAFKVADKEYRNALDSWEDRRRAGRGRGVEPEPRPDEPKLERIYTTDATVEAVVQILAVTPRGILVLNDEMSSFFGRMGRYSSAGPDADRAFWLSSFRGIEHIADRATKGITHVPRAAASIVGGIQPGVLAKCFDSATFSSGLAARFLICSPTARVKQYRRGPTPAQRAHYESLIERLFAVQMEPYSRPDGEIGYRPQRIGVADECRDILRRFVPDWSAEAMDASESVEAAMSKLEGYALRFALLLRMAREALGLASPHDPVSREDLNSGIELARWFKGDAIRVYHQLSDSSRDAAARSLDAWAAIIRTCPGGAVTVREWHKRNTRRPYAEAGKQLERLVEAGLARWRERGPGAKGGKPTQECVLLGLDGSVEVAGCGLRVAEGYGENDTSTCVGDLENWGDARDGGPGAGNSCNPQPTTSQDPPCLTGGPEQDAEIEEEPQPTTSTLKEGCNPQPLHTHLSTKEGKSAHPDSRPYRAGWLFSAGLGDAQFENTSCNPQPATHNPHADAPLDPDLGVIGMPVLRELGAGAYELEDGSVARFSALTLLGNGIWITPAGRRVRVLAGGQGPSLPAQDWTVITVAAPPTTKRPACYRCGSRLWWQSRRGDVGAQCTVCSPPPAQASDLDWLLSPWREVVHG